MLKAPVAEALQALMGGSTRGQFVGVQSRKSSAWKFVRGAQSTEGIFPGGHMYVMRRRPEMRDEGSPPEPAMRVVFKCISNNRVLLNASTWRFP